MYGIFAYIWLMFMVNVGEYTIHGSYGIYIYILSTVYDILYFFRDDYNIPGWWQLKHFLFFTPTWGRWTHFDSYFSNGLKPPTSIGMFIISKCQCLLLNLPNLPFPPVITTMSMFIALFGLDSFFSRSGEAHCYARFHWNHAVGTLWDAWCHVVFLFQVDFFWWRNHGDWNIRDWWYVTKSLILLVLLQVGYIVVFTVHIYHTYIYIWGDTYVLCPWFVPLS